MSSIHVHHLAESNVKIRLEEAYCDDPCAGSLGPAPRVILDLHKNKKSEVDSHIFKTEFLEIKSAYKRYMSIYTIYS